MKIRNGFVSNSSSSSFIVAWPKKPKTIDEMNKILFGKETMYPNPYPWEQTVSPDSGWHPNNFSVLDVSKWLFENLKWGKKKVREELVGDLESKISSFLHEIANEHNNSYTMANGQMVSCFSLATQETKDIIDTLKKHFSRIDWDKRFNDIVAQIQKWNKESDKSQKEFTKLTKNLRQEYGCDQIDWQDVSKMTDEQKIVYNKNNKESYEKFKTKVLEDPRYKTAQEKHWKITSRRWNNKKIKETILLAANRLADIFYMNNENAFFSVVEISDDSNFGAALEHGTLFDNLTHQKFNHH